MNFPTGSQWNIGMMEKWNIGYEKRSVEGELISDEDHLTKNDLTPPNPAFQHSKNPTLRHQITPEPINYDLAPRTWISRCEKRHCPDLFRR